MAFTKYIVPPPFVNIRSLPRFPNNTVVFLDLVTFLISMPIFIGGIWLATKAESHCYSFLQWPVITLASFLIILSSVGLVGSYFGSTWHPWLRFIVIFLLAIVLFCFMVFALAVTNKGNGHAVPNRGFKEYRLGDFSKWLQKKMEKSSNWRKTKSCIQDTKVCKRLAHDSVHEKYQKFYQKKLSPLQSGCCKPPTSCGLSYVNATYWTSTATSKNNVDFDNNLGVDCNTWKNEQDELCYDCDSCKAGILANLRDDWLNVAIINIVLLAALALLYLLGSSQLRRNKSLYYIG